MICSKNTPFLKKNSNTVYALSFLNTQKASLQGRRLISGFFSGVATLILTYPLDVMRVRLSTDFAAIGQQRHYIGLSDCCKKMLRMEGFASFYKGGTVACLSLAPFLAVSFSTYDYIKAMSFSSNLEE